jgi:hypothetical protein
MAINPNTDFSDSTSLPAAQLNRFPRGIVAAQTLTTNFASSAAHNTFQDTNLTLTFTPSTSRIYRVMLNLNPYPNGGVQAIAFRLLEGASEKRLWNIPAAALEIGSSLATTLSSYFSSAASTSTTYKIQFRGVTANTQVSDFGSATQTRQFWIEDLGPA